MVYIRGAYGYDSDAESDSHGLDCSVEPSKTQQQFKDDADINVIVRRFGITGDLPETFSAPQSGDFSGVVDFGTALQAVRRAQEEFMQMPADVRYRFANDPQRLIDFLEDPGNRDEALKLRLLKPAPEVTRDAVKAIDELAARLVPSASGGLPGKP